MTVIAYKAGRMACDALCVDLATGTTASRGKKIYRTKAGALIGESGDADSRSLRALLDNVKCGKKMPASKDLADCKCEGTYLIAFPTQEVWQVLIGKDDGMQEWWAQAYPITGMHSVGVAGIGADLALAFMKAGKSAKEAVAAVCEINAYCAPPVYEERLHPPKPAPQSTVSRPSSRKAKK